MTPHGCSVRLGWFSFSCAMFLLSSGPGRCLSKFAFLHETFGEVGETSCEVGLHKALLWGGGKMPRPGAPAQKIEGM